MTPQSRKSRATGTSPAPSISFLSSFGGSAAISARRYAINLALLLASPVAASSEPPETTGYRISLGLVEISALATLIGATNAEALSLGLAAGIGLPWAPLSTFGALHVVRACLAAVATDRIRDAIGIRNSAVDSAVGMNLTVDATKPSTYNIESGGPIAVSLTYKNSENVTAKDATDYSLKPLLNDEDPVPQAVYAFEKSIAGILGNIPATNAGEKVEIYQFSHDRGPEGTPSVTNDRLTLVASMLKLLEVYALWNIGATTIWWVTSLAWAHGFISAVVLQVLGLSRDSPSLGQVDIVAGELPCPLFPGGVRRVLLGLPCNVRRHYIWKIIWGTGALINLMSVLAVFVTLGLQRIEVVYIWVGFQVCWLLVRTFIYNFIAVGSARRGIMVNQSWEMANVATRKRCVKLILALAKQQVTIHPRGAFTYQEDLLNASSIAHQFKIAGNKLSDVIPLGTTPKDRITDITIVGIVGDTVLRSTGWLWGISLLNSDLYDSVLVFVKISGSIHAVPGVRVLAGVPEGDVEDRFSSFEPRGTSNGGLAVAWQYWIPAEDDTLGQCWLEARGMKILDSKTGVLTQRELQAKLQGGGLNISLVQVSEVERVLGESRKAAETLLRVLMDAGIDVDGSDGFEEKKRTVKVGVARVAN